MVVNLKSVILTFIIGILLVGTVKAVDYYDYNCGDGILYLDSFTSQDNATLYLVNMSTGISTAVNSFLGDYRHNLAVDKNGNVYAIDRNGEISDRLVKLNDDGRVTVVGHININDKVGQLGFNSRNELYAMGADTNAVYKINTVTGQGTLVHNITSFSVNGGDLAFGPISELLVYQSNNGEVYTINLANHQENYIGSLPQEGRTYTGVAYFDGNFYSTTRNARVHGFTLNNFNSWIVGPDFIQASSGDAASCPPKRSVRSVLADI